jgi:3-dehydroquinate synthase
MEALPVSKLSHFEIQSHKGPYSVQFTDEAFKELQNLTEKKVCFIIDKNVSEIYKAQLSPVLKNSIFYIIEATEENKDLSHFTKYAVDLTKLGVKRNDTLVAIGGGIIQDITCFLAATLFRGLDWVFFPTTLLAQVDSCIGSKSSINVGGVKNLMGTFTPPKKIFISLLFLKSLKPVEILSGVGEMIKVHGIAGIHYLTDFAKNYELILSNDEVFQKFLMQSLMIKKEMIEKDEFDTGPRLVMNYGHTFGHAVESASDYQIPHGVAITIGQAMACHYSLSQKMISPEINLMAQTLFTKNLGEFKNSRIHFSVFLNSIKKDKKNSGQKIALIIPKNTDFKIEKYDVEANDSFIQFCKNYFLTEGFNVIE